MRITLNGMFQSYGALRHTDIDTYAYNFSGDAGLSGTTHYVAWYKPDTGDAWNEGYQDTLSDMKAVLTIQVTKQSGIKDDGLELLFYKNTPLLGVNYTEEDLYRSLAEYNIYGTEFIGARQIVKLNGETTLTVEVTDPARLQYLLANGIGFDSAYGNLYRVGGVTLALSGESTEDAPVIELDTSSLSGTLADGTYYHPAGDTEITLGITYSQDLGTAMQALRYTIKPTTGGSEYAGETSAQTVDVPRECWETIPASGVIELSAVSAHGVVSKTLTLPYVITHYNLAVTTPVSGSIVQDGEDVVLAWNLVLPSGMPSAPAPTGYTVWPAWDDNTEFEVAYAASDRTYTIPADSLAGHTKLRLLILDEYGSRTKREKASGALVQLYLQPTASVNGITVEREHTAGEFTPLLTVRWTAEGQTAFQITADDYDTGPIWGTATEYTIPKIFDDGVHVIRLRIQDANGDWGAWSDPMYVNVENQMEETVVFPEQEANWIVFDLQYDLKGGTVYNVYINGRLYRCLGYAAGEAVYLGNPSLRKGTVTNNNEPFVIEWLGSGKSAAGLFTKSPLLQPVTVKVTESAGSAALTAKKEDTGVKLSIEGKGDIMAMADVLIYRDGKMIAQLPGTETMQYEYLDTEACGVSVYVVRLVKGDRFYGESNPATIDAAPETDGILLPDGTWVALRYTQTAPRSYRSTQNEETYTQHFAGREYPVSMRSGRRTKVLSMEYIDKDGKICDVLEAHTGAVVLYKTTLGFGIRGELNNVTAGRGKAWSTVSFRISQCAESAELQYVQGVNAVGI